jgi:hypothetical protein
MVICIYIVHVHYYIVVAYKVLGLHVGLAVCETCQNKGLIGWSGTLAHTYCMEDRYPASQDPKG